MKKRNFDELLAHLTEQRPPQLPDAFSRDVLREIRKRSAESEKSEPSFVSWLRPVMLVQCFSVAVTVSLAVALPTLYRATIASQTITSLDLNVFSSAAPNAPSSLLANFP